ncbi:MAG: hypothetical protein J5802_10810 [Butyrivibrio sp.]|nr:hypothetical protein [Butyrivibrio sp.]
MMKLFRIVFLIIALILIVAGVFMIANGSLEMYPTSEQQGKAHIAGAFLDFVGGIISILTYNKSKYE